MNILQHLKGLFFGRLVPSVTRNGGSRRAKRSDLLLAAVEESPQALLITGGEDFIYANAAFHRLFPGAGDGPADGLNAIATMVRNSENPLGSGPMREFSRLASSAAAGAADHAEISVRMPSGVIEWRRVSILPLSQNREFVQWRAEDITARRELDAIRRREEEMLADFLDHLPAGFFSAGEDGEILYVNQTLADWLGVSPETLQTRSRTFSEFVVDGQSEPVARSGGNESDQELHGEVTLRSDDGETFQTCLLQSQRVGDEGELLYSRSILLRDMAWRKPEDGSAVQRKWLFDAAPIGIVLLDLQGNVTDCNRYFLNMLGRHRDGAVGRTFSEQVVKEDRVDVMEQLSKLVMGTMQGAQLDTQLPASGGKDVAATIYASRVEDDDGEITGLVLHLTDTTQHKHLEDQFAQSQKMQAVGQLAGGVAHDFNNLLTAMTGFADLLLERHTPDDESHNDILQIKKNADRATNLVRQLLAFSRKQTLKPEVLDVTQALADLSNLLGRLIGEKIELKMEPGRKLGPVFVDHGQFEQVVINLVVNARDAMPGGGTLVIRTSTQVYDESVQKGHALVAAGEYVAIEVIDTGVGIAKEDIDRIFEPFFSTKDVGSGTGLGLSTVYGIVHQTKGSILVDSAPGDGTTFTILLPRYDSGEDVSADDDNGIAQLVAGSGKHGVEKNQDLSGAGTVLLVEDEEAVRMFGARALRNNGYTVLEAGDGEAALDVINTTTEHIDLIVSDVVMPGMDGHTLIKLVRQELPDVKVVLMSGYTEDVFAEEIVRDETVRFLAKPFTLRDLAGLVKEMTES